MGLLHLALEPNGVVHPRRPALPKSLSAGVLVVLLLLTSACGSSDAGDGGEKKAGATTIAVHFQGDTVEPLGKKVELEVGQKLVLDIHADAKGELHVHSSPEQEIEYPAGESKAEIVIDRPGVVEVESHTLDKLVLQLEVR